MPQRCVWMRVCFCRVLRLGVMMVRGSAAGAIMHHITLLGVSLWGVQPAAETAASQERAVRACIPCTGDEAQAALQPVPPAPHRVLLPCCA